MQLSCFTERYAPTTSFLSLCVRTGSTSEHVPTTRPDPFYQTPLTVLAKVILPWPYHLYTKHVLSNTILRLYGRSLFLDP
jgi:hypothetical protein